MHNTYKLSIVYFIFFSALLLSSALMLFLTKIGFSLEAISNYYLGNESAFIQAKTLAGLLKVIYPHIFSIGLLAMVLLHFIYFTSFKKTYKFKYLILVSYLAIFLEIFSGFFLILGATIFTFVKLVSFILMFILFLYMFWLILDSILNQKSQKV